MTPVSLKTLLENVILNLAPRLAEAGVPLSLGDIPPEWEVECRAHEVAQALHNVIANAIDGAAATPAPWVRIDVQDDAWRLLVRVCDSGRGVPPSLEGRVFQPFFTTKDDKRCRGLGLSIARGIVERHGGEIFIDRSQPFTCFAVSLAKRADGPSRMRAS